MDGFILEITSGWPDTTQLVRIITRLILAALLGAVVGIQRERANKPAGLRTHMLVALGSALFVVASLDSGMSTGDASRVVQGVAAGVGFLGAGAILKQRDEGEIKGLTTAAGIWMTAAVGVGVGLGRYGVAAVSVVLTWAILAIVGQIELPAEKHRRGSAEP